MGRTKLKDYYILILALFIYIVALWFHKLATPPIINISKQQSATNFDKDFIKLISLGNKRILSSTLWIKTLLDSDLEHYRQKDMNNWMYHRFRTIAHIDTHFYQNYLWGGMYLSIVKDDLLGASEIYELGLQFFPNDYDLRYNTGFNYYFEMQDFKKGLFHLQKIEAHPRTPWPTRFIIQKLRFEATQDFDATVYFLKDLISKNKDEAILKKLKNDLYAIYADRDLECLNSNKRNCSTSDIEGNSYLKNNGRWQAIRKYTPYKINRKK